MWMWHLETWVSGGLGSAGLKINDLRGLVQPRWFCECRLSWLVMPGITQDPPCISQWVNWIYTAKFLVKANLETSKHLNLKKEVHGCGANKTVGLMLGAQMAHELQDTRLYKKCLFWGGWEAKSSDLSLKFHIKFSFPVCYEIGGTFCTLLATAVQSAVGGTVVRPSTLCTEYFLLGLCWICATFLGVESQKQTMQLLPPSTAPWCHGNTDRKASIQFLCLHHGPWHRLSFAFSSQFYSLTVAV